MELKQINYLEVDKELRSLSDGIFGYIPYFALDNSYSKDPLKLKISKRKLQKREETWNFLIEKISEKNIRIAGYVSDESQLRINGNKETGKKDFILFPTSYNEFKNLIYISLTQDELIIKGRKIQTEDGLDICILEIEIIKEQEQKKDRNLTEKKEPKEPKEKEIVKEESNFVKKSVAILNNGKNSAFKDNTIIGYDIGIQDEGENTLASGNKFLDKKSLMKEKPWNEKWWGVIVVGLIILVFGTSLLRIIGII